MAGTAQPSRWTYEDYRRLSEDGNRYEIIRGELTERAAFKPTHQDVAGTIYRLAMNWLDESPLGKCYISPIDVILA